MRSQPSYRTGTYIVVGIVLFCLLLIGVGLYLNGRAGKSDWANGPITPGTYAPPATLPASQPIAPPRAVPPPWVNMLLGNPSGATADVTNRDNYLMVKPYYALAYNDSRGEPNWVSWRVTVDDLGSSPRKRVFDADDTLPAEFFHVQTRDYTGSGFDRGHLCPHSDRAATIEMSYATFVMTNIIPQAPNVNRKAWAQLEDYCRALVKAGNHLYIISGPFGRGGVGSNGPADVLTNARTVVPAECWKVAVVVPEGGDDLAAISPGDRVIAVDMPNDQGKVDEDWSGFRCSARSIEIKTGLHFFLNVDLATRASLEEKIDSGLIELSKPLVHRVVH